MLFFKNKILYLKKRHERIIKEMKRRGFATHNRISLAGISKKLLRNWNPSRKDKEIIKKRLIQRIRLKPTFYYYYRKKRTEKFLVDMVKNAE